MSNELGIEGARRVSPPDKWSVHGYYTLCPYAPDGSGRILFAGGGIDTGISSIYVVSKEGEIIDNFGQNRMESNFYHTGSWQTWSPDSRFVYYQSGSMMDPQIVRRELSTGEEIRLSGDMEGAPPFGDPIVSGYLGMLYAAGYGDGKYHGDEAPIPFQHRKAHGLFEHSVQRSESRLAISVEDVLRIHPDRELLLKEDALLKQRLGENEGLTLMCYCVRWSRNGDRCLFYFGNHCVDRTRGEPRLAYVFTANREFTEMHLALDLSFSRRGVHWSWHPDGIHLVGYGPDPEREGKVCLSMVKYDGTGYKKISDHASGGHPSVSCADYNLLVTDEGQNPGRVVFIDLRSGKERGAYTLPKVFGGSCPPGRNRFRVCHHPVFNRDASKILVNTLPGENAVLYELDIL